MRSFRRLSIPPNAHKFVRFLFREMNTQQIGVLDVADRSGVNKNTFKDWRTRTVPTVNNLNACLNVLGFELYIRPTTHKTKANRLLTQDVKEFRNDHRT